MWTTASYKYQTKFGFVRKSNAYLNDQQQEKFSKALAVENKLYDFALRYLYATYGRKHMDRKVPTKMARNYLVSDIKKMFITKFYGMERWNVKKLCLSSHNAQLFLVQLITNFAEYKKELRKNFQNMDDKAQYNFKMNITKDKRGRHKNSKHKSWYRIGGIGFNADNRTILIDLQAIKGLTVLSMHKINIPDYGDIYIQGNAYVLCQDSQINQVKLKWQHDQTFQIQFVHVHKKPRYKLNEKLDVIGLDWNMTDNVFYRDSNNKQFKLPDKVVQRADQYEKQRRKLQSKNAQLFHRSPKLDQKIKQLYVKRSQLLTETYREMMPQIVDGHQVIVIEKLGTKQMRKPGKSKGIDRGFNRKLALIKPAVLQEVLINYAFHYGAMVIKVDAYKTSQVEYGTEFIQKHSLDGPRTWISEYSGKRIIRDLNAARNIRDWGLHPDHHIKVKLFKKVQPWMVSELV